jgi:hypothetical protein
MGFGYKYSIHIRRNTESEKSERRLLRKMKRKNAGIAHLIRRSPYPSTLPRGKRL